MIGELVYERKSKLSFLLMTITFPLLLILIVGLFPFYTKSYDDPIFMTAMIIVFIFTTFLCILLYKMLAGFDFKISTETIWIKTGFLFKNFNQTDPVEINAADIVKILYLNKTLHIYHSSSGSKKIMRNYIMGGRWFREFDHVAKNVLGGKTGKVKWQGPSVFNVGGRIREEMPIHRIAAVLLGIIFLPPAFFTSPLLIDAIVRYDFDLFFVLTMGIFLCWTLISMILLVPMRLFERMSYKDHGDTFSIQGGFAQHYTEYYYEDIEKVEKRTTLPILTSINPFIHRYFGNPYSAKNCVNVYLVEFKKDYRIFQAGEYIIMKNGGKAVYKQYRYLTIPSEFLEKGIQGNRPELLKTS